MTAALRACGEALGVLALWPLTVFALKGPTDRINEWCRRRDLDDDRRRQEAAYRRTMQRLSDIDGGPVTWDQRSGR